MVAGIHSDTYETTIPFLTNPEDIDSSSIITDILKISLAPDLKLNDKGLQTVERFSACGGHHRKRALELVVEKVEKKITGMENKYKRWVDKGKKPKSALKQLKTDIKKMKASKAALGKWTVILYDESKWQLRWGLRIKNLLITLEKVRADGNRLALELSRSKEVVRKVEDDSEKCTMSFIAYKSIRTKMEAEKGKALTSSERDEIAATLAGQGGMSDHGLKPCLQSELIITYWRDLESVVEGRRFFNTKYFSSKWSQKAIHQPGGGVS